MDLIKKIDEIRQELGIAGLEYEWGGELWKIIGKVSGGSFTDISCEQFTRKLFDEFHCILLEAMKEKKSDELISVIQLIAGNWGGISIDENSDTIQSYVEWLLEYDEKQQYDDSDLLPNHWNGIATWSKILSALDPKKYFIYDSRTAVSLQLLLGNEKKLYLPSSRIKGMTELIQKIKTGRRSKEKFSYTDYCKLLCETEDGFSTEKKLFMLGGKLGKLTAEQQQKVVEKYFF